MYEGFEIVDFHSHFPTEGPWFTDMGDTMKHYVERVGERRLQIIQEKGRPYGEHWRRMAGILSAV